MGKTVGYKAMNMDMTCLGFQFEVGKTYHVCNDEPLELCTDSGFHFCKNFDDVFKYYDWFNCRVFKVTTDALVVTAGQKSITKELTIIGEVTRENISYDKLESRKSRNYYDIMLNDDEDFIFRTFKDDVDDEFRAAVVNKLSDECLIAETFKNDLSAGLRKLVINKLTDEQLIFNTFKDDSYWFVRDAIVRKLTDENLIFAFKDDVDHDVRAVVVENLSNKGMLKYFAEEDNNDFIRGLARKKLETK